MTEGSTLRVRELCQQLKPILGEQAQRIWLAYIAETEEGREQIAEYLELLAAQHFQQSLDSHGPGLVPPKREDVTGEYVLGEVSYNGKNLYPFGLREDEWTAHVGIFGRSGGGKSTLGYNIVQQLIQAGKPVMVLDWKRGYRRLCQQSGFEQVAVYTIGRSISPLSFNPLIPPPQTSPRTWLKKIIAVIASAYLLGDGVIYLLQQAIDQTYEKAGVYRGSVERWPTLRDVLQELRDRHTSGREAGWMSSALRALSSLCFGEMDTLLNQGSDDIGALLERSVILELDALTQSDKIFFAQAMLLFIHHLRMAEPQRGQFRHAIVIEEAHHLLSDERKSLVGGQSVMEITFREIREFGESLICIDQSPSQISFSALANTNCTICFNLKHRTDVSSISQAMLLQDEEKNYLGELEVGEAIVRLQGRGSRPFTIRVPDFPMQSGMFNDSHVRQHMIDLGLQSGRDAQWDNFLPEATAKEPSLSAESETFPLPRTLTLEQQFLQDIITYPASGIAERYHRLKVSVRQGEKLKDHLIAQHLIFQELQTTSRGRVRVLRLTDSGRDAAEVTPVNATERS